MDGAVEEAYRIDWRAQLRRPFRRGFIPYALGPEGAEQAVERRRALGIDVVGDPAGEDATPAPVEAFEEVGVLSPYLLEALRDAARHEPTPLQAQVLPIVLAGQNLVAIARAGLGQAAAYLLPAAMHVEDQPELLEGDVGPIALVLVPAQELAAKVCEEADLLLKHSGRSTRHSGGLRAVNVSGGGTRSEKLQELGTKGAHIMVGTPKRVHDMASKEQISLLRVTFLVLDGMDRMLDLNFAAEVCDLAAWTRPERQTLLFSGTWPRPAAELAKELCLPGGPPVQISVSGIVQQVPAKRPLPQTGPAAAKAKAKAKAATAGAAAPAKAKAKALAKGVTEEEFPDGW